MITVVHSFFDGLHFNLVKSSKFSCILTTKAISPTKPWYAWRFVYPRCIAL